MNYEALVPRRNEPSVLPWAQSKLGAKSFICNTSAADRCKCFICIYIAEQCGVRAYARLSAKARETRDLARDAAELGRCEFATGEALAEVRKFRSAQSVDTALNECSIPEQLFRIVLTLVLAGATNGETALDSAFVNVPWSRELANREALKKLSPRSERRYLARRLQILRAAGKMLRMQSFSDMKMRDIAAAADLSTANLYNYFKGKHELLFFCQDNSLDRMLAALRTARSAKVSAAEKLRLVIESHLRCVLDEVEGSAAHLLTSNLPVHLQRPLIAKRDRYEDGVRQLIAIGIQSGEFMAHDAALATRAILGALNWSVRWFSPEGALTAAQIAEEFSYFLIRGLMTKPSAFRRQALKRNLSREGGKLIPRAIGTQASAN
jgi:AcrR family transcriptional regulator